MATALLQGRQIRCNCFGQLGDAYVSWGSVARNVALVGLAIVPLVVSSDYVALHRLLGPGLVRGDEPPLSELPPVLLAWVAAVLGAALVAALWRSGVGMARSEGGPADDLPETQWIRRLLRMERARASPTLSHED